MPSRCGHGVCAVQPRWLRPFIVKADGKRGSDEVDAAGLEFWANVGQDANAQMEKKVCEWSLQGQPDSTSIMDAGEMGDGGAVGGGLVEAAI